MNTGEKIYRIRKMAGMTQEELAEKMNVSRQTISKWETGSSSPDLETAVRLCEFFGISLNDFVREKQDAEEGRQISLQDMIRINKRTQRSTIMMISGLFFLLIGALAGLFAVALESTAVSLEYMLYRYIAVGEYAYAPVNYAKIIIPAVFLAAAGIILCALCIFDGRKEKKDA